MTGTIPGHVPLAGQKRPMRDLPWTGEWDALSLVVGRDLVCVCVRARARAAWSSRYIQLGLLFVAAWSSQFGLIVFFDPSNAHPSFLSPLDDANTDLSSRSM